MALFGVLLLMLPQVGLTIFYVGEMHETSRVIHVNVDYINGLSKLRLETSQLWLPAPEDANAAAESRHIASIHELIRKVADPKYAEQPEGTSAQLQAGLEALAESAGRWFLAVNKAREVAADAAAFQRLVTMSASANEGIPALLVQYQQAQLDLAELFAVFTDHAAQRTRMERDYAKKLQEHAERNLITLAMLVFIFIGVLFVVLPNSMARPLREMARSIREVGHGRVGVRIDVSGSDEVGEIASAFNTTMEVLEGFDARKRDRIVADGGRLDGVLQSFEEPAAVLTPTLTVEASNSAFRAMFEYSSADDDSSLPSLLQAGRRELRSVLERGMQRRDAIQGVSITFSRGQRKIESSLSTYPCRDIRGRTVGLLLVLSQSESS